MTSSGHLGKLQTLVEPCNITLRWGFRGLLVQPELHDAWSSSPISLTPVIQHLLGHFQWRRIQSFQILAVSFSPTSKFFLELYENISSCSLYLPVLIQLCVSTWNAPNPFPSDKWRQFFPRLFPSSPNSPSPSSCAKITQHYPTGGTKLCLQHHLVYSGNWKDVIFLKIPWE